MINMSPRIDIEALKKVYKGSLLTPADGAAYEIAITRWAANSTRRSAVVTQPRNAEETSQVVRWCCKHAVALVVKCGGHDDPEETAANSVLVDLHANMHAVALDVEHRTLKVEGGALWNDVHACMLGKGLGVVGAGISSVGIGGSVLRGGHGWLGGEQGLSIDNVLACEVVTSNGDILSVDSQHHADLFWAIRGWHKDFGVVTSITLKVHPQPMEVYYALLELDPTASGLKALADVLDNLVPRLPDNSAIYMMIAAGSENAGSSSLRASLFYNGPQDEAEVLFKDVLELHCRSRVESRMMSLNQLLHLVDPFYPPGRRSTSTSVHVIEVDRQMLSETLTFVERWAARFPDLLQVSATIQYIPRRVICSFDTRHTAFVRPPHNSYDLHFECSWLNETGDEAAFQMMTDFVRGVAREPRRYPIGDNNQQPGPEMDAVVERLHQLIAQYDPAGMFTKSRELVAKKVAEEPLVF